jgi:hypothetical protein
MSYVSKPWCRLKRRERIVPLCQFQRSNSGQVWNSGTSQTGQSSCKAKAISAATPAEVQRSGCRMLPYKYTCGSPARPFRMPANENTPKNNRFNSDYALFARSRVAVGFPTSCTVYQCLRRGQRHALSRPIRSRPVSGHVRKYSGLT